MSLQYITLPKTKYTIPLLAPLHLFFFFGFKLFIYYQLGLASWLWNGVDSRSLDEFPATEIYCSRLRLVFIRVVPPLV